MKKKLLIVLLTLICGLSCIMGLTACNEEGEKKEQIKVDNIAQLMDKYGEQTKSFVENEVVEKALVSNEINFDKEKILGASVDFGNKEATELQTVKVVLFYAAAPAERIYNVYEVKFNEAIALSNIASYTIDSDFIVPDAEVVNVYETDFDILDYLYSSDEVANALFKDVVNSNENIVHLLLQFKGDEALSLNGSTRKTMCKRYILIAQTDKSLKSYNIGVKKKDTDEEIIASLKDKSNYEIFVTDEITDLSVPFTVSEYRKEDESAIPSAEYYLEYAPYEDGYEVTGIDDRIKAGSVTIPATKDGKSVVRIGNTAFSENDTITSVQIPDSVTTIGYKAFDNCKSLEKVSFNNGIISIEGSAFSECAKLKEIHISDLGAWFKSTFDCSPFSNGANLYVNDELVTELVIPDDIGDVPESVFSGCTSITSVTISNGETRLLDYVFMDCTSLKSLTIPEGCSYFGYDVFENCPIETAVIPANMKVISNIPTGHLKELEISSGEKIDMNAFSGCEFLESVKINEGMTLIESGAFKNCIALTSVELPDGLQEIDGYAFYGCSALAEIKFPDSLKEIGTDAFGECVSLTSITIPDGIEKVDEEAFVGCSIETAVFPSDVSRAIRRSGLLKSITITSGTGIFGFESCIYLESVTLPDGVITIYDRAFANCDALEEINLPEGVQSIGMEAFFDCASLKTINIPDSVNKVYSNSFKDSPIENVIMKADIIEFMPKENLKTVTITAGEIPNQAFVGSVLLENITLCEGVTKIGDYAFDGCTLITNVVIPDSVTSIGDSAFQYCKIENASVPDVKLALHTFSKTYLKSIEMRGGDIVTWQMFQDYSKLESVILPTSLEKIEAYAFYGCSSLKSITIPANVTVIEPDAFTGCTSLVSVIFENPRGWYNEDIEENISNGLDNPQTAAERLTKIYNKKIWRRNPDIV